MIGQNILLYHNISQFLSKDTRPSHLRRKTEISYSDIFIIIIYFLKVEHSFH